MKTELTSRQQEILDFIRAFNAQKLMPPTLTEIAEHFNIRCSSAAYHLNMLRKKGRLSRTNESRSIVLLDDPTIACTRKTCLRRISFTQDIPEENKTGFPMEDNNIYLSDHQLSLCPAEHYILYRQPDDSLFELGIRSGDILLAVPVRYKSPRLGDLVLAESSDGQLVARTYLIHSPKQIKLAPANSQFDSETHPSANQTVRGIVIALQRTFN